MSFRFITLGGRATDWFCAFLAFLIFGGWQSLQPAGAQPPSRPRESNQQTTQQERGVEPRRPEFDLPQFHESTIAAAGIRQVVGRHLTLYTDLPAAPDVDELPGVFEAAIPAWCRYFGIEPARLENWKLVGCVMNDRKRFAAAGLYPPQLPDFQHGFSVGSQFWVYEQESAYYRRHLVLHEGTHAFMLRWLGGAGPPWYMEGLAELLGTHRWQRGRLEMGVMPARREDVPYWGRVKIIKTETEAGRALSLMDIMRYGPRAHLQVEAYGWCWAAAYFLDQHPQSQAAFRELKANTRDRSPEFSRRFREQLRDQWPAIAEDWQLFAYECDYGYDVARATVERRPSAALPNAGATANVAADRGWQSTGLRMEAGKYYRIIAAGQFQVAAKPAPWPCEAGGITLHYHRGRPLGVLLGAISHLEGETLSQTALLSPFEVGRELELEAKTTGTLYLKINEAASGLFDNSGGLSVTVSAK